MITEGKHLESKGVFRIKSIATKGSSETSTQEVSSLKSPILPELVWKAESETKILSI